MSLKVIDGGGNNNDKKTPYYTFDITYDSGEEVVTITEYGVPFIVNSYFTISQEDDNGNYIPNVMIPNDSIILVRSRKSSAVN